MDKQQNDKRTTEGDEEVSAKREVETPSKKVSQTENAKALRRAILTATLREGFRAVLGAMMDAIGVDIGFKTETLELPEVDDLFDDIEVTEPMENADPE